MVVKGVAFALSSSFYFQNHHSTNRWVMSQTLRVGSKQRIHLFPVSVAAYMHSQRAVR